MLAAECVLGILHAEHAVIRRTVSAMAEMTHGKRWRQPGPVLERLDAMVHFLRKFNRLCHGPKDKYLWHPLWGRSDAINRLLGQLECAHERNADALQHAMAAVRGLACGDESLGADLVLTLRRHRVSVLRQLETEERELAPLARQLLTQDDWAGIASSISSVPTHIALAGTGPDAGAAKARPAPVRRSGPVSLPDGMLVGP